MRKLIVLMVFALLGVATAMAATLVGRVIEAGTNEPLMQASVRVLAAADSSLVKGAVTNTQGRFNIASIKAGKYIVEVSYVGYTTQFRNVNLGDDDTVTLKPFELSESSVMLQEAVVRGIRTPIKVMEDTVEYAAESYKTQPNAVVEDLLKRLPGVEVGSDGKITANGKSVSKILIDGKEFFSDDPTVASRNLPVNMVEKLQVVDRKSDLARLTGVDDGEDETVINLTVKKDMKNGWFGNAEVGYGTDHRYRGTFTVNRFWNGNQLTFLGGANNINEPGFADGASGRFRRFGGDNGITSSQAFGINFNVGREEIFRIGGNVMYSHTDRDTRTASERQYLFTDSTSTTTSSKYSRDKGHNVRMDLRMVWKPDSFNTLEFRPNVSLNYNDSYSTDTTGTFAGGRAPHLVTSSRNINKSNGNSFEFGGRLIYNHNFKKHRGRSFSVMMNYRLSNVREKGDSYSWNNFAMLDSIDELDQYTNNHTWSNNVSTRLTWVEPLGNVKNGNFLEFSYQFNYRWNNADKLTFNRIAVYDDSDPILGDPANGWATPTGYVLEYAPQLSNRFRNDFMSQDIRVGYRRVTKNGNLNVGMSVVPQTSRSQNIINSDKDINRHVVNFAPYLRYRYKFSKSRSLQMFYSGRSSQPSMTQLQPVPDITDPLHVIVGNPSLKPTFNHYAHIRFQDFNSESQRSIMLMANGQYQQNAIVSQTIFDPTTGGDTTTYRNVGGVWNARIMNMISMPLRNKAFTFNNHIFVNYSSSVGYNNAQRNRSGSLSVRESPGLAWRPTDFEFELRPSYGLQFVTNTLRSTANRTVHTYGGSFYATYSAPFGLVLSSDVNYNATSGYANGYDTRTWLWNASISYQFLRNRAAAVTVKAYDILGQKSNVSRSVTANYISDARYNSLTRYVMVSFSYKFNTFGKGNEPADAYGDHRFGPPGPPPGGHRGPMGPPR